MATPMVSPFTALLDLAAFPPPSPLWGKSSSLGTLTIFSRAFLCRFFDQRPKTSGLC